MIVLLDTLMSAFKAVLEFPTTFEVFATRHAVMDGAALIAQLVSYHLRHQIKYVYESNNQLFAPMLARMETAHFQMSAHATKAGRDRCAIFVCFLSYNPF